MYYFPEASFYGLCTESIPPRLALTMLLNCQLSVASTESIRLKVEGLIESTMVEFEGVAYVT